MLVYRDFCKETYIFRNNCLRRSKVHFCLANLDCMKLLAVQIPILEAVYRWLLERNVENDEQILVCWSLFELGHFLFR